MKTSKAVLAITCAATAALVVFVLAGAALARENKSEPVKTVDTGLGFTFSVPESWATGQPSGNNKFVIGSRDDDFAVIVTDFGPAQGDAGAAHAIYRESFAKSGFALQSEEDLTVAGKPAKRMVFTLETPNGQAHAEVVMLTVADEAYAVLVVTSVESLDERRPVIAKIFGSIALKG